ncbi:MAG: UDP-2,3-diacylglucosamine pyrophosphatase LpxI [Turneriella sp.]|nr:UDP-2,3-diacylglucosamine pyrophosphatase LpxI [Turneriella sp.]
MQLAIFAGAGKLPRIAVQNAQRRNLPFVLYHIAEAILDPTLQKDTSIRLRKVSVGEIQKVMGYLLEDKITHIVLLGKLEKQRILEDVVRDSEAEKIYSTVPDRRDDSLFHAFASLLQKAGIEILEQKFLLEGCFLPSGTHTQKKVETQTLLDDIEFGYNLSRRVGSLDIGQTAIVCEKMILAIEAIEGTDAAIARAGTILKHYKGKSTGVVCKTAKASQDARFDLPTVGITTLETMKNFNLGALVVEAAQTLVVDPKEFIERADALGLIVVAR